MREGWTHWRGVVGGTLMGTLVVMLGIVASSESALGAVPGFNGKIAFSSLRDEDTDIYVVDADGSDLAQLTGSPRWDDRPAWSPDGSLIAFNSYDRDADHLESRVMKADGSDQAILIPLRYAGDPAWSPDGQRVAFSGATANDWDIYVMKADGSEVVNVTNHEGEDVDPAWAPDGSRIAFTSYRDGGPDLFVMNADGSGQTLLTTLGDDPAWSSDGGKIAFTSFRAGVEVGVMNPDGSERLQLTAVPGYDGDPVWSPDGRKIAFTSRRDGDAEIYVMNADGSAPWNLSANPGEDDFHPAWQPVPSADLGVSVGASPSTAKRGKPVTYSIMVQNSGPSNALDVTVVDQLPAEVRFVSARTSVGSCQTPETGAAGTVRCDIGFLVNSGRVSVEIEVTVVVRKGSFRNTVYVTSSTPDPFGSNNAATALTQVR